MKHQALALIVLCGHLAAQQSPPIFRYTDPMSWDADWAGVPSRVYFPQWSPNLQNWVYLPTMRFGEAMHGIGGTIEGQKGFLRLAYYDNASLTDLEAAQLADADGDGFSNYDEIAVNFTDPFSSNNDSDGDGLYDGWEVANGLDPNDDGSVNPDNGADGDPDHDGLTNLEEQTLGSDPHNADTDGDGITDGGEAGQGTDPDDPEDKPEAEWFILTGELEVDVKKSRSRMVTIPAGESRLVVVALHSEEYPYYTENFSEFNDILEWDIRPEGKDPVTGIVDVNSLHLDWDLALVDGVEIQGKSPAHIESVAKYSAPGDADIEIEIDLAATNIGDGTLPSTVMVGVLPVEVKDNLVEIPDPEAPGGVFTEITYTGVDDISKTADAIDNGYVEDFWIMAPLQGPPLPNGAAYENLTRFRIGMGGNDMGELSCENGTPTPTSLALDGDFHDILWRGAGAGVDSAEPVEMGINGGGEQFPLPVKVKAMKYRTINVSVFPVKTSAAAPSIELPTESLLIKNLKEVFGYQINAWCLDPQYKPEQIYNYDPDGDKVLSEADAEYALLRDQCTDADADISIILIGGVVFVTVDNRVLAGQAPDDAKPIVVSTVNPSSWTEDPPSQGRPEAGSFQLVSRPTLSVIYTMLHEMGHRIIGVGHPDEGTGPAPLEGVADNDEVKRRLMCSGPNQLHKPGGRLVKKEWDAAEDWLVEREEARNSQGGGQ